MSTSRKKTMFIKIAIAILLFVSAVPAITMLLWNALLPDIFGLTTITFWQALGLVILSKILFSGFARSRPHPHSNDCHPHSDYIKKFSDRMKSMTKEERKAYFQRKTFGMSEANVHDEKS